MTRPSDIPESAPPAGTGSDARASKSPESSRLKTQPAFMRIMDAIANVSMSGAERAVCLAALYWAGFDTGEFYPAVENWARMAAVRSRSLQRIVARLVSRGILQIVSQSRGGVNQKGRGITSHYRLVIPGWTAPNPDSQSGLEPRPSARRTPTAKPPNPDPRAVKPRPPVRGTSKNSHEQPPQQPARTPLNAAEAAAVEKLEALRRWRVEP